jgi:hypothetical protein
MKVCRSCHQKFQQTERGIKVCQECLDAWSLGGDIINASIFPDYSENDLHRLITCYTGYKGWEHKEN